MYGGHLDILQWIRSHIMSHLLMSTQEMVMELVMEFTGDQMEMINEVIAETIMGQLWR